eukprot:gene4120-7406_t
MSEDKTKQIGQKLKIWGNASTMNLPTVLMTHIHSSKYFKKLFEKNAFKLVLTEIIETVTNLEPYSSPMTPSNAYCLLYKLFTMKLTGHLLKQLLKHKNCYVQALGMLYIRYTVEPEEQLKFYEEVTHLEKEFEYKSNKTITIGKFMIEIILDQKFLGTLFPRIPVVHLKKLKEKFIGEETTVEKPKNRGFKDNYSSLQNNSKYEEKKIRENEKYERRDYQKERRYDYKRDDRTYDDRIDYRDKRYYDNERDNTRGGYDKRRENKIDIDRYSEKKRKRSESPKRKSKSPENKKTKQQEEIQVSEETVSRFSKPTPATSNTIDYKEMYLKNEKSKTSDFLDE